MISGVAAARNWPVVLCLLAGACASDPEMLDVQTQDVGPSGTCDASHRVDGVFSSWPNTSSCFEWSDTVASVGSDADLYLQYDDTGRLFILHDRHKKLKAASGGAFEELYLLTGNGQEQWQIRVYDSGITQVERNGQPTMLAAEGALGFARSPRHDVPHVIMEVALPVLPSAFTLAGPDGDGHTGALGDGFYVIPKAGVALTAITASKGVGGDTAVLSGTGFGAAEGGVTFGGSSATVTEWSPTAITVVVPEISGDVNVVVHAGAEQSNPLRYFWACRRGCAGGPCPSCPDDVACGICPAGQPQCVDGYCECIPNCLNRECGADGCGGQCGACADTEVCLGGQCNCKTLCDGADPCGPDGCGGSCGGCVQGALCLHGSCCKPDCSGIQCGGDGCEGLCGDCPENHKCLKGVCICNPQCGTNNCGPNGCGGVCGSCLGGHLCVLGKCKCLPSCVNEFGLNKECGDNGCGGHCGLCPEGKKCTKIGLCTNE